MPQHRTENSNINTQSTNGENYSVKNKRREKRPPKKITPTYLHNSGIYYLERFVASKAHFKTVMARKAKRSCHYHTDQPYDECLKMIDEVADKFEAMGLLNDALYTNGMVTSLRRRGMSRSAIIQKMRIKGIDRDNTIAALNALDDAHHDNEKQAEIAAALRLAKKKKMGPYAVTSSMNVSDEDTYKITQRNLGRFARAGFSYEISKKVLEMQDDELEEYRFL